MAGTLQALLASLSAAVVQNTLFTWGSGLSGRLGHGDVIFHSSPVQVGALTDWAQVSVGDSYTACVKTDGTLFTWGASNRGELGHGNVIAQSSPVQVGALTNWKQVSAGAGSHMACVKTDGTLFTWGANNRGQLGHGNVIYRSSPVQVGALTDWAQVSVGSSHTACVKTNGTLFTWGLATSGRLGLGNAISRSSPVQVGALTNWAQVSCASAHTACVKTDGTLFTWGDNLSGQLGTNNRIRRSSPVQVGALTNWKQVSASPGNMSGCVKTNGTLFTWGSNYSGRLGLGNVIPRSSPVQVGALTDWKQLSLGSEHGACVKTNGTLFTWGANRPNIGTADGRLGHGDVIARSSPVQVGALTNWAQVSAGSTHTACTQTV